LAKPKLLFCDIETSPLVAYLWATRNQDVSIEQIIAPTSILCVGFAEDDGPVEVISAGGKLEGRAFEQMIRRSHQLLSSCDAVVHFNGTTFDVPRLNAEFVKLGLPPPPPFAQIDLKKVVMSKFAFTSSKLAFVGPALKIGEKVKNEGWSLWDGCLKGDKESWRKMEEYNMQDVVLLRDLYKRVLPWIDNHPNLNLYVEGDAPVCPNCGSEKLVRRGIQRGATLVYRRYNCANCGRWARGRVREKTEPVAGVR
jgi:predicted RNA-binding Zn-ribbon protein involved in translation (DUF1610 family)